MSVSDSAVFKIKDSVDLFLTDDEYVTAYYMNSRKRREFHVSLDTVRLLESIDGHSSVGDIKSLMLEANSVSPESTERTLVSLQALKIITEVPRKDVLSPSDSERFSRQINYLAEFFENETEGQRAQNRIASSRIAIFGCGAVGGDISLELAMAGVRNLVLFDYDTVSESDVSRHLFFRSGDVGMSKVASLAEQIHEIDPKVRVETIQAALRPQDDIESLIEGCDFIVNTMDEPYIGYTSAKISRVCVKHNKPHYIAGGFDAHLASTGELILPHITPCAECYARYFKKSLRGWKPSHHPVEDRSLEIGGLSPMSLFSSSFAALEILKFLSGIVDMEKSYKPRGEWLFDGMTLSYLDVKRDPQCPVCGEKVVL